MFLLFDLRGVSRVVLDLSRRYEDQTISKRERERKRNKEKEEIAVFQYCYT